MNYYNPYLYSMPSSFYSPRIGLFSRLFGNSRITLGGILNGTQRALNFANQAIPLVKQVKPMIGNAKTMFKVMNEFKRVEKPSKNKTNLNNINSNLEKDDTNNININTNTSESNNNGPTFFV